MHPPTTRWRACDGPRSALHLGVGRGDRIISTDVLPRPGTLRPEKLGGPGLFVWAERRTRAADDGRRNRCPRRADRASQVGARRSARMRTLPRGCGAGSERAGWPSLPARSRHGLMEILATLRSLAGRMQQSRVPERLTHNVPRFVRYRPEVLLRHPRERLKFSRIEIESETFHCSLAKEDGGDRSSSQLCVAQYPVHNTRRIPKSSPGIPDSIQFQARGFLCGTTSTPCC